MSNPVVSTYRFGNFELIPRERVLLNGTERVVLPPRVFDTLTVLVHQAGQLVEKEKLMRVVWPDTVVEENNLSQIIYLLRKTLHDGEDGKRYIETVPKRGYRFVGSVQEMTEQETDIGNLAGATRELRGVESRDEDGNFQPPAVIAGEGGSSFASRVVGRTSSRRNPFIPVSLVVALFLAGLLVFRWSKGRNRPVHLIRSIAVLPLLNLSNDAAQEYFADGMTDALITDLAQVKALSVVSNTSIMQYKHLHRSLPEIGRELGVDAIVEGSVLRVGDRVRIDAQLVEAATDRHLWAKSYEGEVTNVFSLQALVAEAITNEIKLSLTTDERDRFRASRTVNPDAYEAYLRGRYAWNRRDREGFRRAVEYFQQAIEKDANFALAYAGLADCYTLLALEEPGPEPMPQARAAAEKALALDDGLAEAHTSLAAVKVLADWDWAGAEKEFRRALEINPNYAPAHHWYGNILLGPMGRHREAITELRRAQSLDPLSLIINTDLGYAYYLARQDDAAFSQYHKVLEMDSSFVPLHFDLAAYYASKGMYDDWQREQTTDFALAGQSRKAKILHALFSEGGYFKAMNEIAHSQGTFEAAIHRTEQGSFCTSAQSYAALGKTKSALASLERCFEAREPGLLYLKVDPAWDSLRSQPDFQNMLRRMGLM